MSDITLVATQVRPLLGAITRMFDAGEAMTVGDVVRVSTSGTVVKGDASTAPGAKGQLGIVVAGANAHSSGTIASGERVTVVVFGPVFLGSTVTLDETKTHYLSDTAGKIADAAGTVTRAIGNAESNTVFFFNPSDTAASS